MEKQQDVLRLAQVHVSVIRHTIDNNFNSHSCCDADPIETTKKLLESSFFTALKVIYMNKIKKIIEREWWRTIERTAELAIKSIEKQ